jgi:hypothetical protein
LLSLGWVDVWHSAYMQEHQQGFANCNDCNDQ